MLSYWRIYTFSGLESTNKLKNIHGASEFSICSSWKPFAIHQVLLSNSIQTESAEKHVWSADIILPTCGRSTDRYKSMIFIFLSFPSPLQARLAVLDSSHSSCFHCILKGPGKREERAVSGGRCYTSWVKSGEREKAEFNGIMQMSSCNVRFLWEPALRISAEQSAKSPL